LKNIDKKISMRCPVCANDQFSTIDENIDDMMNAPDDTKIKCSDCGRITTKGQLIEDNRALIDANVEDLKKEAIDEVEKELKKIFKKLK
jgi:uncharacterized Zn finger protein